MKGKRLFIGGIPFNSTVESLRAAFGQVGTVVDASIASYPDTGRSKGFGFIEMSSEAEAQAAIDLWHNKEFEGRMLKVDFALPKSDAPRRPAGDFRPRRSGGDYGRRANDGFGGETRA